VRASDAPSASSQVLDLDGRLIDPFETSPAAKLTVFLITTIDCPVSNRYAPAIRSLHDELAPKGVRFVLVYADPRDEADEIRMHLRKFEYPMRAVRDPQHELVRAARATVTPEAAVFDAARRLIYRGRIDDRQVDFGVNRPRPTRRDLYDAIAAGLEGRQVPEAETKAVGCILADLVR
jgi:hypothetical protein